MVGIMGGKPKVSAAAQDAERRAREAEAKAALEDQQRKDDEEYRRIKQRGKVSTILTTPVESGRTTLGG